MDFQKQQRFNNIKRDIELMNAEQHMTLINMLKNKDNNIEYSNNNTGSSINLNNMPENIIECMEMFIKCIEEQNDFINRDELKKEEFQKLYFNCK
ncbi:hypothetical protein N8459_02635 [Nitrosopumilus sp.]|nr:hypothetical protein [Nitrosopumilus sp.]